MTITKLTENEAVQLKLDSYLMQIHTNVCARCDCGERYSELYEVWVHPTKTRLTGFKQLRRTADAGKTILNKDLAVAYIELPDRQIPICSDCVPTYQSTIERNTIPAADPAEWAATLKRKYAPASAEPKIARASAPGKQIPTLDEL